MEMPLLSRNLYRMLLSLGIACLASGMTYAADKNTTSFVLSAPTTTTTTQKTTSSVIPLSADAWTTVYDGYGSITYDSRYGIVLEPQAATAPSITHAALTLANIRPAKNFRLSITASTVQQLRLNSPPNPWEVFWIFFNYKTTSTGKNTNYFLLKPTGVELGTAYDQVGQKFLQTGDTTASAIGVYNKFDIEKIDNHVVVYINGQKVIDYTGDLFNTAGTLGLYTEDARVHVTNVQFTAL